MVGSLVALAWWVGVALALPRPPKPMVPHNVWNPFFGTDGFPTVDVHYMNNLRGDIMRDLESRMDKMSSAINQQMEQISSAVSSTMTDISNHYDEMVPDLSDHFAHVDDMVTGLTSGFSIPSVGGDMFQLFGSVRQPWWKGKNVCINREMLEDGDLPRGVNITYSGQGQVHMQVSQCREDRDLYECTQSVMDNGVVKTARITYSCCVGFKRLSTGTFSSSGCEEYEIKPIEETIAGLDGTDFLSLISEHNLLSELVNSTVFVPDNQAMDDYYTELKGLESLTMDNNNLVYNIDDGLRERRKRELLDTEQPDMKRELMITEQPDMKRILLGHISPKIIETKDLTDRSIVPTKNTQSQGIRVRVYNTVPERTVLVNCARITSKDHHTRSGLVHVVDRVVQPATLNIAEILASDTQFRSFRAALGAEELEMLANQNEEFTVFVPSDAAFQKLEPEERRHLLSTGACGSHILRSHILRTGGLCSGLLAPGTGLKVANLQDEDLIISKLENGRLRINNDIDIIVKDIVATNGVLHVIESLIVPASARPLAEVVKERVGRLVERMGGSDKLASRLVARLAGLKNATLLLPSEAVAGGRLLPEELLRMDEKRLEEVLLHHIIPEARDHQGFKQNEAVTSLAGRRLQARLQGGSQGGLASLSCARILQPADKVCGGSIYTVDRLLVPPEGDLHHTLAHQAEHKEFKKLIEAAGLSELVDAAHTIFAPVDAAFRKISDSLKKKIFGDKSLAEQVVRQHIVPHIVCCHSTPSLFYMYRSEPNIAGDHLQLRRSYNGRLMVNGAGVVRCDVAADNGILHSIDTVLLPPELQERRSKWGLLNI